MSIYDLIIAGGGASGLGLAYQLAGSPLRYRSTLIVDRDPKNQNDRTWSFWVQGSTRFDHLVYHIWDQAEVVSENFRRAFTLHPYQYRMIRGIDFYQGVREAISDNPQVHWLQGRVGEITDMKDKTGAQVMIDDIPYGAGWVFDSIPIPGELFKGPAEHHYLKQHFKGWEIVTPQDSFDSRTVTLFDFRTPQKGAMRFFSILPFSRRRALVKYIIFSDSPLKPHEYDRAIADYLENVLRITTYRTESVETGVVPITDRPFHRKLGERIMAIGARGGLVKPSSGYAFLRMQNDAASIVNSLITFGDPFHVPVSPGRYHFFDTLMLQVMHRQGDRMKDIFIQLFKNNSIQEIFAFFDESAALPNNLRLVSSLPHAPFLNALFRVKFLRKV